MDLTPLRYRPQDRVKRRAVMLHQALRSLMGGLRRLVTHRLVPQSVWKHPVWRSRFWHSRLFRRGGSSVLGLLILAVLARSTQAQAAPDLITSIVDQFQATALLLLTTMQTHGRYIFGLLATLELIVFGVFMLFRSSGLAETITRLTIKVLILGMLFVAMESAFTWLSLLTDSFMDVGQHSITMPSAITAPSEIIDLGRELAVDIQQQFLPSRSFWTLTTLGFVEMFAGAIASVGIYFSLMFAAVALAILLIELALALVLSPLLLAFAGLKETSGLAASGLTYIVALGVRVMMTYLIIIVGAAALKTVLTTITVDPLELFFGLDLLVPAYLFWKAVREIPPRAAEAVVHNLHVPLAELHELGRSG